jgi:hypothetical protein
MTRTANSNSPITQEKRGLLSMLANVVLNVNSGILVVKEVETSIETTSVAPTDVRTIEKAVLTVDRTHQR